MKEVTALFKSHRIGLHVILPPFTSKIVNCLVLDCIYILVQLTRSKASILDYSCNGIMGTKNRDGILTDGLVK
jgi:hypothetical protein